MQLLSRSQSQLWSRAQSQCSHNHRHSRSCNYRHIPSHIQSQKGKILRVKSEVKNVSYHIRAAASTSAAVNVGRLPVGERGRLPVGIVLVVSPIRHVVSYACNLSSQVKSRMCKGSCQWVPPCVARLCCLFFVAR